MEEIKEIILSHCQGIAYPEFDLEDLNVMVKEINDHYTKVQSQELTKAKGEVERLKGFAKHNDEWTCSINCSCGLDELLKDTTQPDTKQKD